MSASITHRVPRLQLAHVPTPVERMDRLAEALGKPAGTLLVKRDDQTGLAAGGNKLRKLEFVVADALARGADHLVTIGGRQSNAARMTAAVARRHGLGCTLILAGEPPARASGNVVLNALLGAELIWSDASDPRSEDEVIADECERLRRLGRAPYPVAVGASTPLGALGYVEAARELLEQVPRVDVIVTATGSAGTHAGLVAGIGDHDRVLGIRVGTRPKLRARVEEIANGAADLAGLAGPRGTCRLDDDHLGDGYAAHTESGLEAMVLTARTEGLILDPVYTAKSMAGLISACRTGAIARDHVAVFLHTGGLPGLLADEHAGWVAERLMNGARAPGGA